MNDKFRIILCSDLDYEEMVADICYEDYTIALLTQEKGIDNMEIEILPLPSNIKPFKIPLDGFIRIINFAKKRLIEMQKIPDEEET